MSAVGPKPLRVAELASAPYPELAERDPHALDRALIGWAEALRRRLPLRRRMLARFADRVDALEPEVARLPDAAFVGEAASLRAALRRGGWADAPLARCFALVREASRRQTGRRHHRVQLMGGRALAEGWLAEMATGEGKTLTAAAPAIAAALAGLPVHVVTVNDYLAERDAEGLAPLYAAFGLTTGVCRPQEPPEKRRAAYAADICYGANKEIAFDYLRDRVALGQARGRGRLAVAGRAPPLLLRGLGFAIVDEADSVLVDEARTPLIISADSGPGDDPGWDAALEVARGLCAGEDYEAIAPRKLVRLTDRGRARLEAEEARRGGLWAIRAAREELAQQALSALLMYRRDAEYVVADGKVQIVDEGTGRIAEGRTWERGLHQLIEAKEGVERTGRRVTLARITYQRFFRRYLRLSGMTGTGWELAGEIRAVYGLPVVRIPTHRPPRRKNHGARLLPDEAAKWKAVAEAARAMAERGRAVLVGTRSVAASEALSARLAARGLPHTVLNARSHAEEAEIVSRAGAPGRITVATNMAGRGTDIHLDAAVREAGGLHVILTEHHESARVDRQLIGRGARQGDPGSFEVVAARDDELFRHFAGGAARALPLAALRRLAQARAAATRAAERARTLRCDIEARDRMGFAGLPE